MPNFTITTLGCKVNQCESEAISASLTADGWSSAAENQPAQLCIVNTCAVTSKAAMQSRQAVRKLIRSHPRARIVVTGCYAQTEPEEISRIKGIHDVIDHGRKHRIPQIVQSPKGGPRSPDLPPASGPDDSQLFAQFPAAAAGHRSRPFLKIHDGCDAFCTYCIVPHARGAGRSMEMEDVLARLTQLQAAGFHEVVLTGIHLGAYGMDLQPSPASLFELLLKIHESKAMDRIRLSSIEPFELNEDIIMLAAQSGSICHHFHVPLQSGDDEILRKMHRPYTRAVFKDLIHRLHHYLPEAAIGTDVLVGFPGESEAAFDHTCGLIEELPLTYLHVFPFSPRKQTPASRFPGQVPSKVTRERCRKLRDIGNIKKLSFYDSFIGKKLEVLVEGREARTTGNVKGITSNYIPVYLDHQEGLKNTLVSVSIDRVTGGRVFGTVME
ncbi:MAG: tRNA (N(6)-L-threonylcarbamoyladenosine(37)-C(2))-methylthiotransferase MtaB [Desulfobacterales bacterium]|nr:tRNA (N(6)-L-threonylcarbamoyladenosine(37)-C(2))-methylthiotransferase MtaB [Desulfobacterales bacterium]